MADDNKFTQADLDAAVKAAIEKETEGLKSKIEELIGDNKKLKQEARKASEIKPEHLQEAEDRAEKAEAALAEAQKQVKTLTGERDKAVKALETETSFTQKLLISDGLKSALIANGVKDEDFIDSLTAKFSAGAKVVIEGEERKALYGDKPLGDFIKEWAGSDAGKKFVAAAVNGGGGAPGSGGGGSGKTMLRSEFNNLDEAGQRSFIKDGGKLVDAAA